MYLLDRIAGRVVLAISLAPSIVFAQSTPTRKSIPTIAKIAKSAVVLVVMGNDEPIATGTGFVVSEWLTVGEPYCYGAVVTNYHVIAHGKVGVAKFSDGTALPVDGVLAADKVRDLAVIRIHLPSSKKFQWLTLGNSDRVEVGEEVVAIGNPLGLEQSLSNGIVSGVRSDEKLGGKFLQVTAPISHGSSGGPLFNMTGEVIGVTSMFLEGGENLNFAIPSNDLKRLIKNPHLCPHCSDRFLDFLFVTELHGLPNEDLPKEHESATKQQHATTESPEYKWPDPVGFGSVARKFYEQDNEAGMFNPENFATAPDGSKLSLGRMSNADYVCFSSDARSDEFFTFQAWAYDREYDESRHLLDKVGDPSNQADREDFFKRQAKQNEIQRAIKQDAPYLNFLFGGMVNNKSSPMDRFFLSGGRMLQKDIYSKGVKVDTFEYHWGGTSWFFHDLQFLAIFGSTPRRGPDTPASTPRARHLSMQLFREDDFLQVLRYIESDEDYHVVASGHCQRMKCSPQSPRCM